MSEPVMQRMKISREGVLLIKSFEGFNPRAVQREDGRWVVGYGHTASAREGASVSEVDAELLLQYDLIPVQAALSEGLTRPVNQHQLDALASFAFSVGPEAFRASDVLSQVNAGAETGAADAMIAWPERPMRDAGLRRRAAERALFVADPGAPVTLSDLLSAPLPAPLPTPVSEPFRATVQDTAQVDAQTDAEIPTMSPTAGIDAPAQAEAADESQPENPAGPQDDIPASDTIAVETDPSVQTVSPSDPETFDQAVVATPFASDVEAGHRAAPETFPEAETPIFAPITVSPEETSSVSDERLAERASTPDALVLETVADLGSGLATPSLDGPIQITSFAPPPIEVGAASNDDRAVPYDATRSGLGALVMPDVAEVVDPFAHVSADPFTGAVSPAPSPMPAPIVWPALSDETAATGALDISGSLAGSAALASPRLVWPREEAEPNADTPALFEDDGGLNLSGGSTVWAKPFEARPAGFSWRRVWAYLIMGGFGLVSLAVSMAALRKASLAISDVTSIVAIASVLAIIGAACVGVSAYNIYQRLSDDR